MRDRPSVVEITGTLVILAALAVCCAFLWGAPAPLPRRHVEGREPHWLCGRWVMTYGRSDYDTTFYKDGRYTAVNMTNGNVWDGTWAYDGMDHELWVYEGDNGKPPWLRWHVILDSYLSGRWGAIDVKLRKPKPTD